MTQLISLKVHLTRRINFCCRLISDSFSCEHVWEISLTLAKEHHEWLTLGRILDLTDLFPSSGLCIWLVLYPEIIQCFQLCLDCFRLFLWYILVFLSIAHCGGQVLEVRKPK